jgi:hypothetical protein
MTSLASLVAALDRCEPNTPPSARRNRIVKVAGRSVLQMVDPNDAAETRHQYIVAGGALWHRKLPAEGLGDEWIDDPAASQWERIPRPLAGSLLALWAECDSI